MTLHLALTGGIGSGKSTAAGMLVERGAVLIDADVLARLVVEPGTPALERITATFGHRVLAPDGTLDRPALAAIVFGSEQELEELNRIVHPEVRRAAAERLRDATEADPGAIIVEDIPLLSDPGEAARFQGVIVVHTPQETRIERLIGRGMTETDARSRIEAQASDADRFAIADAVVYNDGSIAHLRDQIDTLWDSRLAPYRDALLGRRTARPRADTPPAPDLARIVRRLQVALARAGFEGAEVRAEDGGHVLVRRVQVPGGPELAVALQAAGFVPHTGGGYVGADPATAILLRLE